MNLTTIELDAQQLQLSATHRTRYDNAAREYVHSVEQPQAFEFAAQFTTREAADAFAAQFPKSHKFRVGRLSSADSADTYVVSHSTNLLADEVNGGINETGVKRYHAIVRVADRQSIPVVFDAGTFVNSYATRELFESTID